ncbi:MAG: hypothetical protein CVT60_06550 [Actinobacteria bacterium HGW-Actinobacteria-10]|nr:MAG: hypothetical protein CVT60_06550 [Actinobacteria bacterium HGW-Actinobacteria-10]
MALDILIIMNNYFHDVATATLLAAAVIMWALERQARAGTPGSLGALARAYPLLTRFARWSLAWIVLGGIPRVIFFNTHDLGAVRGDLIPAIAVKHVVEVVAVVAGVLLWRRVRARIDAAAAPVESVPGESSAR